jgi:hypothetical protein
MREREMRLRVERYMQTRLRSMLMPATLGLGLAIGGCNSDALSTDDGGEKKDAAGQTTDTMAMKYMAQMPDAGPEAQMVTIYGVVLPKDAGPETSSPPDGSMAVRYGAQMADAGVVTGPIYIYGALMP